MRFDADDGKKVRYGGGPDQVLQGKDGVRPVLQIQDHEIEAGVTHDFDESGVRGLGERPHDHSLRERLPEALDGIPPD